VDGELFGGCLPVKICDDFGYREDGVCGSKCLFRDVVEEKGDVPQNNCRSC